MRIALVTETWRPSLDGVVTRLGHTVDELVGRGHEVLVLAPTTAPAVGREPSGLRQARTRGFVVPFIDRRRRWGLPDGRVPALVHDFAPDVVHVVSPVLMGTWAVRQLAGRHPLVVSLHTDLDAYASRYHLGATRPVLRQLNQAAYRQADLALATSRTGVDLLAGLGVPHATVWPPAVDRSLFTTRAAEPRSREGRVLEVACVGRLAREKGYDVLRPVVGRADDELEVRLTFVGDGPDRRRLCRMFAGTPTTFVGAVRGPALAEAYRAADVVVFTSTTDTVGLVLLEAVALDRPVVAVDTRASRDTLDGYPRAALVARDASPGSWRTALAAVRASEPSGRSTWPLSWSDATDVLLERYREVVERVRTGERRQAPAGTSTSTSRR